MGNKREETKQKIKATALELFSQKGFSSVSVRDIGKAVGIKESTLYYHFKNKQTIFDELLSDFEESTKSVPIEFNHKLSTITQIEKTAFIAVGLAFLNEYLLSEKILKFLRMLMLEQAVNEEAAKLYHKVMFEDPLQKNAAVFSLIIQMGLIKQHNAQSLALAYYSPIFLIFQRHFAKGEVTQEIKDVANTRLTQYLHDFYDTYIGGNDNEGL